MANEPQDARLTAVAVVRTILNDDPEGYQVLLETTSNHRELAAAACGLAASLMAVLPDEFARHALDAFLSAALDQG